MDHDEIKNYVAPCGLSCEKCCAYSGGSIQLKAHALAEELGESFGVYAKIFQKMNPVFDNYQAFDELLRFFAEGSCTGCRGKGCLFHDCEVAHCEKDHKVDFCFQCSEFPCAKHGFNEGLAKRWQANNEQMKSCGLVDYYNNIKDKPRYP